MARLLIIDDEESLGELLRIAFSRQGHDVEAVSDARAARQKIETRIYDVIVSDIRMPDLSGLQLLEHSQATRNPATFILITAVPDVASAIEALNLGAYRYVVKTDHLVEELKVAVERALEERTLREENELLRRELSQTFDERQMVGRGPKMQRILDVVRNVAPTSSTILVLGESGVGKELIARAVHAASLRRDKPFVSINCGALPENLLESELFGYRKGAFTGADTYKKGIIESAHGGTLLLDEIGETSVSMQVKLLRVLQERRVRPLGATEDVPVDVRLVATTHRDLKRMVSEGQFREDFYYRISVIPIEVPPLRERQADLEALAHHFLQKFAAQMGKPLHDFDPDAMAALHAHAWPGNVRELQNALERAVAVSGADERLLRADHLPESVLRSALLSEEPVRVAEGDVDFEKQIGEVERRYLLEALEAAGGVRTRAAELLHMSYRSFRHHAQKHGV